MPEKQEKVMIAAYIYNINKYIYNIKYNKLTNEKSNEERIKEEHA